MLDIDWKSYYEIISATHRANRRWNELKWDANTPPQNHGRTYVLNQASIPQLSPRIDCLRVAKTFSDTYKYLDLIVALPFCFFVFSCLIFRYPLYLFQFSLFRFSRFRFYVSSFFVVARVRAHGAVPSISMKLIVFETEKKTENANRKGEKSVPWSLYLSAASLLSHYCCYRIGRRKILLLFWCRKVNFIF